MAWEYGPIALGALSVSITDFFIFALPETLLNIFPYECPKFEYRSPKQIQIFKFDKASVVFEH
jgi:hypothetical protein